MLGSHLMLIGILSLGIRSEASRAVMLEVRRAVRMFDREERQREQSLLMEARTIANVPLIGAALDTHDPLTVRGVLIGYQANLDRCLYLATDDHGRVLAALDPAGAGVASRPKGAIRIALAGSTVNEFFNDGPRLYQIATAPVVIGGELRGTIALGSPVDDSLARALKATSDSEVSFVVRGHVVASTFDQSTRHLVDRWLARQPLNRSWTPVRFRLPREGDLLTKAVPLPSRDLMGGGVVLIQQSLGRAVESYERLLAYLVVAGFVALLIALAVGIAVTEGVTRRVLSIATAARALSSGEWNRRVEVNSTDELADLADAFNQMADRLQGWDETLRSAVDSRTHDLNEALGRLDTALNRLREFSADAAHELLTPLTIVRGEIEVALRKPRPTAEYERVLATVLDEVVRLTRIVEGLLSLAQSDDATVTLRNNPVDLDPLLIEVTRRFMPMAEARSIALTWVEGPPVCVTGDTDALERLFSNLMDNAINYSPEGGTVTLRWRRTESRVEVDVADTGMGIDPEHLPRLFDRFYRVDRARSRRLGGTGLGLAIARWVVKVHDGELAVASRPGEGSTFTVSLPVRSEEISSTRENRWNPPPDPPGS